MSKLINFFWNGDEHRLRSGWRILSAVIIYFALYKGYLFIMNYLGAMLYYSSESPMSTFIISGTVRIIPPLIALWLTGNFLDRRKITDFGFSFNKNWWKDFGFGFCLGALLMIVIFFVEYIFGIVTITETFHTGNTQYNFIFPFMVFLFAFLCVGIGEELFARGYLIKNLSEGLSSRSISPKTSIMIALVFSSILFGIGHWGNPNATFISTFNISIAGVFLGAGYIYTGQLAIPIGLHFAWNFFQANVFGFPVSGQTYPAGAVSLFKIEQGGPDFITGGAFGPEAGLMGLLAMLLGIVITYLYIRNRKGITPQELCTSLAEAPQK